MITTDMLCILAMMVPFVYLLIRQKKYTFPMFTVWVILICVTNMTLYELAKLANYHLLWVAMILNIVLAVILQRIDTKEINQRKMLKT